MRTFPKIVLILLVLLILFIGILFIGYMHRKRTDPNALFILPRLEMSSVEINYLDREKIKMNMLMLINNASPFGVHIDSFTYKFYIADVEVAKSSYPGTLDMNALDTSLIKLPVTVALQKLINTLHALNLRYTDTVAYRIDSEIYFDLPFIKNKPQHISTVKYLPVFQIPEIKVTSIHVDKFGMKDTYLNVAIRITNDNNFILMGKKFTYQFSVNGENVSSGEIQDTVLISACGESHIEFPLKVDMKNASSDIIPLLFNKKNTDYALHSEMTIVSDNKFIKESLMVFDMTGKVDELSRFIKNESASK